MILPVIIVIAIISAGFLGFVGIIYFYFNIYLPWRNRSRSQKRWNIDAQ